MSTPKNKQAAGVSERWKALGLWAKIGVSAAGLVILFAIAVLAARWLTGLDGVKDFMESYPGHSELPASAPVGLPAWLGW